ncbi:RNA polymerase sigma factor [Candidatus Latescibacterota bacterium]
MESTMIDLSQQNTIDRCRSGEQTAYHELYEVHKNRIYSTCYRILGNEQDAEDATQETFIRVFRSIENFRGDSSFTTWLYRIAVNTGVEVTRKRKRHHYHDSIDDPDTPETVIPGKRDHVDSRIIMEAEIAKLPDGCRIVFVLHTVEGFKHREIAEMLDINEGTSKSQLSLAKERLREQLLPYMEVLKNEL